MGQRPIDVIVGERIAGLRTSRGVSQDQLRLVLGTTGQQIADYEAGKTRIPPAHLIEVCKFFQVTLQSLFPSSDSDYHINLH